MKRTLYRDYIIDYDNLGRLYIHNCKSPYSEDSDKKYVQDWHADDPDKRLTDLQAAKQLIDEEIELKERDVTRDKRTVKEMEQIETTDNNGCIDVGFEIDGIKYIARSIAWSEADLDETSQDFKSEFYQKILDSHLYEKV